MSDYVPVEYPKWIGAVLVNDEAEEHALLDSMTAPAAEPAADMPPAAEG